MSDRVEQADELRAAIAGLEAQRSILGEAVFQSAVAALRQQLANLDAPVSSEERKVVTILFVDVSGFTALSEKLDAEEVRRYINGCFEYLVPCVEKYDGTISSFIGDEIMALFGAPAAHENDPERALRAALEMMDAIETFNRAHRTDLGIHIGINTGPVVTGKVGTLDRRDYSVMGDAVNLAARLEDASVRGQIFVGPNTYRHTSALFDFEALPAMKLHGKEKPVPIHRLIGLKAAPKRMRGIEGLWSPLVGRDSELKQIQSAVRAVGAGRGGVCAIVGEAGMGKSRLVAEALQSDDIEWAEGRALSHTEGMSYWMARDVLRALLGIKEDMAAAQSMRTLLSGVEEVLLEQAVDVYPYLARLLEIPLPEAMEERVKFLTGQALQEKILRAFKDYVRARAKRAPLILFWEDLHWCDPSSLRVVQTLVPLANEVPLLLLFAYRPEEDAGKHLQGQGRAVCGENCRIIELSPLTREQSGALIQSLLKIDNLPAKMRGLILDRAEGNPFFVEELLRSLLDTEMVVVEQNRVVATQAIESLDVPETLQGVLMARIDRLPPDKKQALQNAAVIGRIFQEKVLARLHNEKSHARKQLNDSLTELQRREFVRPREKQISSEREYIFKHAITHDVAYNTLLRSRRKQLHKLVGEALEILFPDRIAELSATLGYHFERAEEHEKAIRFLRRAGERAQGTFANAEAIGFYQSALEQIDLLVAAGANASLEKSAAETQEKIADVELLIGRQEEARAAYQNALARVPKDEVVWPSRLHRKTAKSWMIGHQYDNAEQSCKDAEMVLQNRVAHTIEWQQEWLQLQLDRMWLHYWQGQIDEIAALAARIRPLVEEQATALQRGNFFHGLTLLALRRDRYVANEETIANAQASLAAIEQSKVLPEISHARFVLGFTYLWAGKFDLADEWIRAGLKLSEQTGDVVLQSRCLTYLTVTYRKKGDVEAARYHAEQSLISATTAGMIVYIGMAKGNLAWVHLRKREFAAAYEEGYDGAEKINQTPQDHIVLWVALWPLIGVAIAREQIGDAIKHVEEFLVPPQMAVPADLETQLRTAVEAWKRNDSRAATLSLKKAVDLAKTIGYL